MKDLLDLCRLNLMEENIKISPIAAPEKDATLKAIDRKKRELVIKIKPAPLASGAMERHMEENTVDGVYPWTAAKRFQVDEEPKFDAEENEW